MLKNFVLLSGFSTFVVIVIVGLNIFHNSQTSSLPSNTQIRIDNIPPNFDIKTINSLKKRVPITVDLQEKSNARTKNTDDQTLPTPSPADISKSASQSAKAIVVPTLP